MRIKAGEYDILESGTVISIADQPITFYIDDLYFEFVFVEEPLVAGHKMEAKELEKGKGIQFVCVNFNYGIGLGNTTPLQIGEIENKVLYLSYRIHALQGHSGKTIHYTWLTKPK